MTAPERSNWGYLVAWEFRPKQGAEKRFETAYGPNGVWAKFFAQGDGFIRTELNRDLNNPGRYRICGFLKPTMTASARTTGRNTKRLTLSARN